MTRRTIIAAAALLLAASCGGESAPPTSTASTAASTTVAAGADRTTVPPGGTEPAENTEPRQLRTWSVELSGALSGEYAPSDQTDLSVSTAPPSCSHYEVIVYDSPTRTSRVAVIEFRVADAITAPGTFELTSLEIGVVGDDGFSVATTFTGTGTLEMTRYDGGTEDERRMAFSMAGSASDDTGATIDVVIEVDWNDSCDR